MGHLGMAITVPQGCPARRCCYISWLDWRNVHRQAPLPFWCRRNQLFSWTEPGIVKMGSGLRHQLLSARAITTISSLDKDVLAAKKEQQSLLWQDFFSDPSQWVDNRRNKKNVQQPDFRHKTRNEALWIKNAFTPSWVEIELANLARSSEEPNGESGAGTDDNLTHVSSVINFDDAQELQRLCADGRLEEVLGALQARRDQGSVACMEAYWTLLQHCNRNKSLDKTKLVHSHIASAGLESSKYLGNALVNSYVICGSVSDALTVFSKLPQRAVVSWTALMSGLTRKGEPGEALKLYRRMQEEGVQPNTYTYVAVLKACASLGDIEQGKAVHREVISTGCAMDLFVGTALVDMYAKCGSMREAQEVFTRLRERDVVSWTAMITGYSNQDQGHKALQLYADMKEQGVRPDLFIFAGVLKACGSLAAQEEAVPVDGQLLKLKALEKGKRIHEEIQESGCKSDVFVGTSIVDMYAKCGSTVDAQRVFDALAHRNVASWNALMAGHLQQEQYAAVFGVYHQMQGTAGVDGDCRTMLILVRACMGMAAAEEDGFGDDGGRRLKLQALEKGKFTHAEAVRVGCESDTFVGNSMAQMFARCGDMVQAELVFQTLSKPDIMTWRAMVAGYALQGQSDKAWEKYTQLQQLHPGAVGNQE